MAVATRTVFPEHASIEDGRLTIGGCDAVELAREFGTPAYVYAEDDLRSRAREFKAALAAAHKGPGEVVFASKALTITAALKIFAEEDLWVDVASGGELFLALGAGFDPERIVLHGNAKSESELQAAVDAGVGTIVLDGEDPERLERILETTGPARRQKALVRVTPGVRADTHEAIMTGHAESKFGYGPATAGAIAHKDWNRLDIEGLHIHLGSQLFDISPFRAAISTLAGLGEFGTYDLGGGMGVPYTRHDRPPSAAEWVTGVVEIAHEMLGADKRLMIEPGRALVANAGVTLYSVQDVKPIAQSEFLGTNMVAVDGGMSDNLRPMLYGAVYEAEIADRFVTEPGGGSTWTVVGKHCESGDVLVRGATMSEPRVGDVVVLPATGAYGHAMASNYNSVPRPPVIFCSGGTARLVVRRETFEDLVARDA